MSQIVRTNTVQCTIQRPDGSVFNYSGPPEELSIVISQMDKRPISWERYQPLLIAASFFLFSAVLLAWVSRPTVQYQPQSWGRHERTV